MNQRASSCSIARVLAIWLCFVPVWVYAEDPPALSKEDLLPLGKAATALVEVNRSSYGSAFCIHPSGLFITNNHVVEGADGEEINSCWGFLGDSDYVRGEMRAAAMCAVESANKEVAEAAYWAERDVITA